jgi:hypothetical protein
MWFEEIDLIGTQCGIKKIMFQSIVTVSLTVLKFKQVDLLEDHMLYVITCPQRVDTTQ